MVSKCLRGRAHKYAYYPAIGKMVCWVCEDGI